MKVFLSHQRADAPKASEITARLRVHHGIESYLDVIDVQMGKPGPDLAAYLRREIAKCTHLLAVTSFATRESQWVPWEIGVATEKDYPLATFADYTSAVPEFLAAWPYLRTMSDVDAYARAAKSTNQTFELRKRTITEASARQETSAIFFEALRRDLNQPISRAK
jgi:hypothetical protein